MKKETFEVAEKELIYVGIIFVFTLISFKIAFFKEDIITIFRTVFSLFWLFVLPGYFAMLYWQEKLEFIERFVIGIAVAAGITGIFSYYIGLIGLGIKYHLVLLPLILILIGIVMNLRK